jgi:hypothetical protein
MQMATFLVWLMVAILAVSPSLYLQVQMSHDLCYDIARIARSPGNVKMFLTGHVSIGESADKVGLMNLNED